MQSKRNEIDPSEQLAKDLVTQLLKDEEGPKIGPEARRILAQGHPITYRDDAFPGELVKMYPDGRREIIDYDENYNQVLVRKISDERIN